jgi:hypothetical protein
MKCAIREGGPNSNTGLTQDTTVMTGSNGKREREIKWGGSQETLQGGVRNCIPGFEGSQAVPVRPCGRGNAFFMTLEGLHYSEI